MNRELKFRAFHKPSGIMYWFDIMNGNNGNGNGWIGMAPFGEDMSKPGNHRGNLVNVDPADCEMMAFTSRLDKMCKEIYDGDILEGDNSVIYKVFFCEGSFMASVENEYKDKYPMPYHLMQFQMSSIRVIGNIYENRELL
jgi:hypothetical protein